MSATPISALFSSKKSSELRDIQKRKANPLNWFERMRERRAEREAERAMTGFPTPTQNSGIADAYRNIDEKILIMASRTGKGDAKEIGKLASMNDVKYYNERSNVLKLARMNPVLKKQIRNATPGNPEVVEAVVEGGGAEEEEDGASSVGEEDREAGDALVGGAEAEAAAITPPAGFLEVKAVASRLPPHPRDVASEEMDAMARAFWGADAGEDLAAFEAGTKSVEEMVAKYGAFKDAPLHVMLDVLVDKYPTNDKAKTSIMKFLREAKMPFFSPKFIQFAIFEKTGRIPTEAQIREMQTIVKDRMKSTSIVPYIGTKEDLDKVLDDTEEYWKLIQDLGKYFDVKENLQGFSADFETPAGKELVRDAVNTMLQAFNSKAPSNLRSSLELRKQGGNTRIGVLYVDGKPLKIANYANFVNAFALYDYAKSQLMESSQYSDEDYPSAKKVFAILDAMFEEEAKKFRERKKGGRPKGSKNKTPASAMAAVVGGGGAANAGGDGEEEEEEEA